MRVARAGEARGRCRAKVFAGFSWFSVLCFLPEKVHRQEEPISGMDCPPAYWGVCFMIGVLLQEGLGKQTVKSRHANTSKICFPIDDRRTSAHHQTTAEGTAHQASGIERTTTGLGTACHPCCTNTTTAQLAGSHELTGTRETQLCPDDDDDEWARKSVGRCFFAGIR
jgi:hypothetical protein